MARQKNYSFWHKIGYFVNSIFALLLLAAYAVPYIKPEYLGSFAGISLLTPILILINVFFAIYWTIKLSRTLFLSLIILLLGFPNLTRFYKISGKKILLADDIKVLSYNVRMFNKYDWIEEDSIPQKIANMIDDKAPDIVCLQEYSPNNKLEKIYPYQHIIYKDTKHQFGQAIFSKHKIINKGNLNLEKTGNNILYADVKIDQDTIRVYNIHLQSLKINPKQGEINEKEAVELQKRINSAFIKQQLQVEKFLEHEAKTHYSVVVAGDFNNTAFSWPYRSILKGRKDCYVEAGKSFSRTFDYSFPVRIDFIMVDKEVEVHHFKSYKIKYSDHFPIMARLDRNTLLNKY